MKNKQAIKKMELLRLKASIKIISIYGRDSWHHRRMNAYCTIKNWINHKKIGF